MASTDTLIQEPVKLRSRRILMITGGTVVVAVAAVAISAGLLSSQLRTMHSEGSAERPSSPPAIVSAPISGIENSLIERDRSAQSSRRMQQEALRQWGWEDRDAGVVHIPIDRAMQWTVERSR